MSKLRTSVALAALMLAGAANAGERPEIGSETEILRGSSSLTYVFGCQSKETMKRAIELFLKDDDAGAMSVITENGAWFRRSTGDGSDFECRVIHKGDMVIVKAWEGHLVQVLVQSYSTHHFTAFWTDDLAIGGGR